jgi:DNA polymerase-3 subunit epsilon
MYTKELLEPITSFVCFDIETTGLDPSIDKIIEIGGLKVKDKKIVGVFKEFINPGMLLPGKIIQITNITDDMLINARGEEEVVREFIDFVGDDIIIGHNIKFDYSFIKTAAKANGLSFEKMGIDTLDLCKRLHTELTSKSLGSMCKYYGIQNDNAHRAYDDAKATALLYVKLCNEFFEAFKDVFRPKEMVYKIKKSSLITLKQKNYLIELLKYHNIDSIQSIDTLTQSEASKIIDGIILNQGRII